MASRNLQAAVLTVRAVLDLETSNASLQSESCLQPPQALRDGRGQQDGPGRSHPTEPTFAGDETTLISAYSS